ncbi:Acyltransferase family protein [Micromonospora rhizosphaerae]|uniref:Acyltransferase family protein n=1 Tax=Micromonospora rhizosphaerae TaxID=568872 RepID=A0A1C6SJQ9_9ACTN|nr:acyltransferase [Micromonospora rhizosphaerae]SCL29637.1 Acyltransferase family protein [Micromonospora rhizosphaerae]
MSTVVQARGSQRLPQIDNLKTAMVAWIIAGHALLGYTSIGGWPYDEVNEVTFDPRSEWVLAIVIGPSALFVVGTFFFLAGLFSPAAVAGKGPARFAGDRILRLGVPFLCYMGLIWPLFMWAAYRAAGYRVSYWWAFTHRQPLLDSGPLWFAEVLLYFSLAYAAWSWATTRLSRQPRPAPKPWGGGHLVALAVAVVVTSFVIRLWFPARSTQILDLHLWQWPQSLAMFGLGVVVARHGWIGEVPEGVRHACGLAVVVTLAVVPVLAVALGVSSLAEAATPFLGGWHWQALLLASVEACLVVAGSVWALGTAQRRLLTSSRLLMACGRAAYAAFALQGPVLLTLAIAARPLPLPAEAKALVVGALAVPACFWIGWLIIEGTRRGSRRRRGAPSGEAHVPGLLHRAMPPG